MKQYASLVFLIISAAVFTGCQGHPNQERYETFLGTDGVQYTVPNTSYVAILTDPKVISEPDSNPYGTYAKIRPGQRAIVDSMGQLRYNDLPYGDIGRGDNVRVEKFRVFVNGKERIVR